MVILDFYFLLKQAHHYFQNNDLRCEITIGFNSSQVTSSVFLTDKKFLDKRTNSTPLNSKSSLTKKEFAKSFGFFSSNS